MDVSRVYSLDKISEPTGGLPVRRRREARLSFKAVENGRKEGRRKGRGEKRGGEERKTQGRYVHTFDLN
jgi:hypothetical protein